MSVSYSFDWVGVGTSVNASICTLLSRTLLAKFAPGVREAHVVASSLNTLIIKLLSLCVLPCGVHSVPLVPWRPHFGFGRHVRPCDWGPLG